MTNYTGSEPPSAIYKQAFHPDYLDGEREWSTSGALFLVWARWIHLRWRRLSPVYRVVAEHDPDDPLDAINVDPVTGEHYLYSAQEPLKLVQWVELETSKDPKVPPGMWRSAFGPYNAPARFVLDKPSQSRIPGAARADTIEVWDQYYHIIDLVQLLTTSPLPLDMLRTDLALRCRWTTREVWRALGLPAVPVVVDWAGPRCADAMFFWTPGTPYVGALGDGGDANGDSWVGSGDRAHVGFSTLTRESIHAGLEQLRSYRPAVNQILMSANSYAQIALEHVDRPTHLRELFGTAPDPGDEPPIVLPRGSGLEFSASIGITPASRAAYIEEICRSMGVPAGLLGAPSPPPKSKRRSKRRKNPSNKRRK